MADPQQQIKDVAAQLQDVTKSLTDAAAAGAATAKEQLDEQVGKLLERQQDLVQKLRSLTEGKPGSEG